MGFVSRAYIRWPNCEGIDTSDLSPTKTSCQCNVRHETSVVASGRDLGYTRASLLIYTTLARSARAIDQIEQKGSFVMLLRTRYFVPVSNIGKYSS